MMEEKKVNTLLRTHNSSKQLKIMILEKIKWQEFHKNGQLHIDGEIGIVSESTKHLYDHRTEWKGYEGKPVVRLGIWTNYYDNGQIWWQLDYRDSMHDSKMPKQKFPSFRKDGTQII